MSLRRKASAHRRSTRPRPAPTAPPSTAQAGETSGLRQVILETARAVLDEQGVAGLSLREVARRAGVTHQAPYHHFGDRESILAELVAQGFDQLARRLTEANDRASAEAYVGFARTNPGVFRVMFRPDVCDPTRFPDVLDAGARALAELQRLVATVHGERADAVKATLYWAHVHGLSCLMLDGPIALQFADEAARRTHLEEANRRFVEMALPDGCRQDVRPRPRRPTRP